MVEFENSSPATVSTASDNQPMPPPPEKKKRNLPGMPDPDSEVIALSPTTLMATNRFVCEICSKGFQRDQNLQLHRRGHNLPWKLRQRASNEVVRKRVYVCPEASCVHHHAARALGDLTGIKKHFSRKHGEKKWKCERCSKKYAVQSDCKAHMKVCGTREYKCDCGTLFSRRDSFVTHRAFCDVLADDRARAAVSSPAAEIGVAGRVAENPKSPREKTLVGSPAAAPPGGVVSPDLSVQSSELPDNQIKWVQQPIHGGGAGSASSSSTGSGSSSVFGSIFSSVAPVGVTQSTSFAAVSTAEPTSLSLYFSNGDGSAIFQPPAGNDDRQYAPQATMSATALLQKAAQMGSSASLLRGLGLTMSSPAAEQRVDVGNGVSGSEMEQWSGLTRPESSSGSYASGLGLPSNDFMMGSSSLFNNRPATVDFLGLGVGPAGPATSGFSALLTSFTGGGFHVPGAGGGQSSSPERNSNAHSLR